MPGHAPQRPGGWNDPYGQRSPEAGEQPAGQYTDGAAGDQAPEAARSRRPAGRPGVRAVSYPDLPDGRPQYGVRVTDR